MINYNNFDFLTAFLIGLTGNIHCLGMCSGIIILLSLGLSDKKNKKIYHMYYNIGRCIGYVSITSIAFVLGFLLLNYIGIEKTKILKLISAFILIILGLYILNVTDYIKKIEHIGLVLWNIISPLIKKLIPIQNPIQAIFLGFIWAHVPCGLFYSTLIWSLSSGIYFKSIILIVFFWIASKIKKYTENKIFRLLSGIIIIILGLLDIYDYFFFENCH